ncbi:MAG: ABC transporter substrate-binding protein, partial [Sulfuricellaceae bacterium]|nr:ABC transporter substrate-binding protein [Sulfuricellaceae bacterium]
MEAPSFLVKCLLYDSSRWREVDFRSRKRIVTQSNTLRLEPVRMRLPCWYTRTMIYAIIQPGFQIHTTMKKLLRRASGFALLSLISAFILSQGHEVSPLLLINSAFGAEKPPIIIAHVAPTTGRFALHSEADRRGAEMVIDEFNAHGGVLGREIVLVSRNPTLDKNHAAQVAEDLISRNKVGFLLGAIDSGVAASMSAVCQKHGVIFINTNSSSPTESVENAHRTKFVFDASGANFNRALLKYALAKRKSKRVLLLTEDNAWGHSSAAASRAYIVENGGTVVGEVVVPET